MESTSFEISLHAVDPCTVYVWWEGPPLGTQEPSVTPPIPRFVLRVIEVSATWTHDVDTIWESDIGEGTGKHIKVPGAGRSYVAEIGIRHNGTYRTLARSHPRLTPWGRGSSAIDPHWPPLAPLYEDPSLTSSPGSSSLLSAPPHWEEGP